MQKAPEYKVFNYDFSSAGSDRVELSTGFFKFLRAVDAAGVEQPAAFSELAFGEAVADFIPWPVTSEIRLAGEMQAYQFRLKWAAQPNVTKATFLWGADPDRLDIDASLSAQLVVGDLASSVSASAVTVGTSEASLVAANSNRRGLVIQNLGGADIFIGPTGVTTSTGLLVAASGGKFSTETTNAEIFGISGSAGNDVRVWEEG